MNKLKIAVLDNGADEKILALCGLPDIIQQNKGNISDEEDLFLHGTNCAMIIGLNCADAELYSYKLLDNTGKGNVDDLKSAFDWCLMNNIMRNPAELPNLLTALRNYGYNDESIERICGGNLKAYFARLK